MADPNLTESAWQRAKEDAAGIYKTATFGVALAIMELLAVPAAVLATAGHEDTARQVVVPILSGAVALAFAFIVVLVVQVAAAPVRQRNELRAAWSSPVGQPTDIGLRLWNAYRKGSELSRRLEDEPSRASYDRKQADQWAEETAELLAANVPKEVGQHFFSAGENEPNLSARVYDRAEALKKIIDGLG
jgi:hypothetical protein